MLLEINERLAIQKVTHVHSPPCAIKFMPLVLCKVARAASGTITTQRCTGVFPRGPGMLPRGLFFRVPFLCGKAKKGYKTTKRPSFFPLVLKVEVPPEQFLMKERNLFT